ncbi:MAG: S-methyl-5'-thioadenosine phosphorylase, partial [Fervidicoccaceae archaeon]
MENWLKKVESRERKLADIAIIGGSGLYDASFLSETSEIWINTPYGSPSDSIIVGKIGERNVAFLPRHGRGHRIPPHKINYRANMWALKTIGVKLVISVSAVGSLREDYRPGDLAVPDQFIDMTKRREYTYFDGPRVAHVSMARPFCEYLRGELLMAGKRENVRMHGGGTYV